MPAIAVPVYPGGSGMARDLNFAGGELRSITHCGGGGGASILKISQVVEGWDNGNCSSERGQSRRWSEVYEVVAPPPRRACQRSGQPLKIHFSPM